MRRKGHDGEDEEIERMNGEGREEACHHSSEEEGREVGGMSEWIMQ